MAHSDSTYHSFQQPHCSTPYLCIITLVPFSHVGRFTVPSTTGKPYYGMSVTTDNDGTVITTHVSCFFAPNGQSTPLTSLIVMTALPSVSGYDAQSCTSNVFRSCVVFSRAMSTGDTYFCKVGGVGTNSRGAFALTWQFVKGVYAVLSVGWYVIWVWFCV